MASNSDGSGDSSGGAGGNTARSGFGRDYDTMKQQYEKANNELTTSRRRCDYALTDLDYYREQHRAAMNQLEVSSQDSASLRTKYAELLSEKQRLEMDNQRLRIEFAQMYDHRPVTNAGHLNDSLSASGVNGNNIINNNNNNSNGSTNNSNNNNTNTTNHYLVLAAKEQEIERLRHQCELLNQDRIAMQHENTALKQHILKLMRASQKLQQQYDEAEKQIISTKIKTTKELKRLVEERNATLAEYSLIMSERDQVHKEMEKLSDDLAQAVKKTKMLDADNRELSGEKQAIGYQLESLRREITSALHERDRALKECTELREKLHADQVDAANMAENHYHHLHHHHVVVRRRGRAQMSAGSGDPSSSLASSRSSRLMDFSKGANTTGSPSASASVTSKGDTCKDDDDDQDQLDDDDVTEGVVGARRTTHRRQRHQQRTTDTFGQTTQEIESLRKSLDKTQSELAEAIQEAEVSKGRRDWAFSERDKIVQERESIRTLCDNMRKERDRAVSELAESLRESDAVKKQRNELVKEVKQLKEILMEIEMTQQPGVTASSSTECHLNNGVVNGNGSVAAVSGDFIFDESSLIDLLEIELNGEAGAELGVELAGGRDDPHYSGDGAVYVAQVAPNSMAHGKLRPHDRISKVNDVDCSAVSRRMVMEAIRSSLPTARIAILRNRTGPPRMYATYAHTAPIAASATAAMQVNKWVHTARLVPSCHGLTLSMGIYISRISEGSLAARDKSLSVGDRILRINDKSMDEIESIHEAMRVLNNDNVDAITVTVLKISHPECSNVFTPAMRYKRENRSSQTEDVRTQKHSTNSHTNLLSPIMPINEKSHHHHHTQWFKDKIDMMRGKRHAHSATVSGIVTNSKEEKKKYRNSSPNPLLDFATGSDVGHEQAIAELDFVLDSYRGAANAAVAAGAGGTVKRRFNKCSDGGSTSTSSRIKDNGGTWPKARALSLVVPPSQQIGGTTVNGIDIIHSGTTTVVARRPKQRPALSLLKDWPDPCMYRNSCAPLVQQQKSSTSNRKSCYEHHMVSDFQDQDDLEVMRSLNLKSSMSSSSSTNNTGQTNQQLNRMSVQLVSSPDQSSLSDYRMSPKKDPNSVGGLSASKYLGDLHGHHHQQDASTVSMLRRNGHHRQTPPALPPHRPYQDFSLDGQPQFFVPSMHPFNDHHLPYHHHHHYHSPSLDAVGVTPPPRLLGISDSEGGTFPRKREQRFRIPSNPSVTSKLSTGSIERATLPSGCGSERGSPMPTFNVEVLSPGGGADNKSLWTSGGYERGGGSAGGGSGTGISGSGGSYKPLPGELRRVRIDKSNKPLGIQINCPETGGIFVSSVSNNSLASKMGLQIGDQLLEVCGINMRNATYNLAANVLRQCGNSITMLVQYSPDKYHELGGGSGTCSGSSSNGEGEATPCNSPKEVRKSHTVQTIRNAPPPATLQRSNNSSSREEDEPRYLFIKSMKTPNLGISLVGGNAAGIFIHSVQSDSVAYHEGLRTGDQILEYNGCDLRNATAEEAAYELAKPADKVQVLAHYRIEKYNEIKDKPGDSLYVRCGFDRSGNDLTEPPQLSFTKDDVLYVDNTMFNGIPGQWRAWRLDNEGRRQQCGVIPSRYKVEEELILRRSSTSCSNSGGGDDVVDHLSSGRSTARRSFFRRKKHSSSSSSGQQTQGNQRHSKELASFCSLAPSSPSGWYSSDGGSLHEDMQSLLTSGGIPAMSACSAPPPIYQRVERLAYPDFRPVLVLGPLSECVVEKLVNDFPDEFGKVPSETRRCSQAQLDRELADGHLVEYRRRGSCWECVTVASVRQVSRARLHCMLDVAVGSVERLHRHAIYPIVLLVKFKSTKQIREVKDAVRFSLSDKLSGKAAKEMFEHGQKLEVEYRHLVTAVVAAGANMAHLCAQVKTAVHTEHRKSQWVPVG